MPEEKRKEIWDDGVHFTEKGYDLMGDIIAGRLVELISEINVAGKKAQKPLKVELKSRSLESTGAVEKRQVEGRKLRSGRVVGRELDVTD